MFAGKIIVQAPVRWVMGLLLVPAIGYMLMAHLRNGPASLDVSVVSQQIIGSSLVVTILSSNSGPRTLINSGRCEARYQMDSMWITNSFGGYRSCICLLMPGESRLQRISLPRHTRRIQPGYCYEVAVERVAISCRLSKYHLPERLIRGLALVLDCLPEKWGDCVEFWGRVNEIRISEMRSENPKPGNM